MTMQHLDEFIQLYHAKNFNKRRETWSEEPSAGSGPDGRWRKFSYADIMARDKTSLDIFWIKDQSLTDLDNLPDPDILASEIVENLQSGLNAFQGIVETLEKDL